MKTFGQVKTIVLDPVPSASGFTSYQLDVYTRILAASKRSSKRILLWIQQVEISKLSKLECPSGHCDDLERSFAEAVVNVVTGQVRKDI